MQTQMKQNNDGWRGKVAKVQEDNVSLQEQLEVKRADLEVKEEELDMIEEQQKHEAKKLAYTLRRQMESWRLSRTFDDVPRLVGIHDCSLFEEVERMFSMTAHGDSFNGKPSNCGAMRRAKVVRIEQI